jgi:hypothetical protein
VRGEVAAQICRRLIPGLAGRGRHGLVGIRMGVQVSVRRTGRRTGGVGQ